MRKALLLLVPLGLAVMAACTGGGNSESAHSLSPGPTTTQSPSATPSAAGTATPSVSAAPADGEASCRNAKGKHISSVDLSVTGEQLEAVVNVVGRPWAQWGFKIDLDVASPHQKYVYFVEASFRNSHPQSITVMDTRRQRKSRVTNTLASGGQTISFSVPLSQLPGISPQHFVWRSSFISGLSHSAGSCPAWNSDPQPYAAFPDGSSTKPTKADVVAGPINEHVGHYITFASPSRNIICGITPKEARCRINEHSYPTPRAPAGGCPLAGVQAQMRLTSDEVEWGTCGYDGDDEGDSVLPYGYSYTVGDFECTSKTDGMHCRNTKTDIGFWLSRTRHDSIGYTIDPNKGFTLPDGPFTFTYDWNGAVCHMDADTGVVCTNEPFDWNRGPKRSRCPSETHAFREILTPDSSKSADCVSMPNDTGVTLSDGSVILGDYRCDLNEFMTCRNEATDEYIYVRSYLFSG